MSKAKEILDSISAIFGYDQMKKTVLETGTRRLTNAYWVEQAITQCYNFLTEGKDYMVIIKLYENCGNLVQFVNSIDLDDIENDNCTDQDKLRTLIKQIITEYKNWKEEEYKPRFQIYKDSPLFKKDEITDNNTKTIDPAVFLDIDEAVRKGLFKNYLYRVGKGKVHENTKYHIYPIIGISSSLEEWFSFIDKQSELTIGQDEAIVTLFYKLDDVSKHYNSFVITIHQKDSIWVSSDQIDFDNPRNKKTSRRAERRKEAHYDHIGLPYELSEELDELRSKSKSLIGANHFERINIDIETAKSLYYKANKLKDMDYGNGYRTIGTDYMLYAAYAAREELKKRNIIFQHEVELSHDRGVFNTCILMGYKQEGKIVASLSYERGKEAYLIINKSSEILFKDIEDLHVYFKMYFLGLVSRIFEQISHYPPKEKIMLASTFLDQKLLSGAQFAHDEAGFSGYGKEVQERVTEIIESIDMQEKTLVLKKDYLTVLSSVNYERSWLGTPKSLNNLTKWSVMEDERTMLQHKVTEILASRKDSDKIALEKMLNKKSESILSILFLAKNVEIVYSTKGFSTIIRAIADQQTTTLVVDRSKDEKNKHTSSRDLNMFYDGNWRGPRCQCCEKQPVARVLKTIRIRNYHQLVMILNLKDRNDLPLYYRNFKAHDQIPYHGNSILDNTHPYALLSDPCSANNPNGLMIDVVMCKRCYNNFEKTYNCVKETVIINYNREILDNKLEKVNTGVRIPLGRGGYNPS